MGTFMYFKETKVDVFDQPEDYVRAHDAKEQHDRLLSDLVDPKPQNPIVATYIKEYTRDSRDYNFHLLHKHNVKGFEVVGGDKDDNIESDIEKISSAIKTFAKPLPETVHTYAGVGMRHIESLENSEGGKVHFPAFTSTSINPTISHSFAARINHTKHLIHFILPKGYDRGVYIAHPTYSAHHSELEMLLDKGQTWHHVKRREFLTPLGEKQVVHTLVPHDYKIEEAYDSSHPIWDTHLSSYDDLTPSKNLDDELKATRSHLANHYHAVASDVNRAAAVHSYCNNSNGLNDAIIKERGMSLMEKWAHDKLHGVIDDQKPLVQDIHVYSGMGSYDPSEHIEKSAGHFTNKAWLSTSIDPLVASNRNNFKKKLDGSSSDHVIHFHLPAGFNHGMFVGHVSSYPMEHEFVIKPGIKWKIYDKEELNGRTVWHARPAETTSLHEAERLNLDSFAKRRSVAYSASEFEHNAQHARLRHFVPRIGGGADFETLQNHKLSSHKTNSYLLGLYRPNKEITDTLNHQINVKTQFIHRYATPLKEDVHTFAGVSDFGIEDKIKKSNGVLHTPAFTSTSIEPAVANWFGNYASENNDVHILHFHLPAGYNKGFYVDAHDQSPLSYEREFLLDKDQKWKLTAQNHVQTPIGKNVKIYSLTPHDHTINETSYHDPKFFAQLFKYVDVMNSEKSVHSHLDKFDTKKQREQIDKDVDEQHQSLKHHPYNSNVYNYTEDASSINQHLLNKHYKWTDTHIDEYDKESEAISKHIAENAPALEHDIHVYSGFRINPENLRVKGTNLVHTPAFTSTSIHPLKSIDFTGTQPPKFNDDVVTNRVSTTRRAHHILHFHLPAGFKRGIYVGHFSAYPEESEYLLDKDQKWKLAGVTRHNMTYFDTNNFMDRDTIVKSKFIAHYYVHHLIPHDHELYEAWEHDHDYNYDTPWNVADFDLYSDPKETIPNHLDEHKHLIKLHDDLKGNEFRKHREAIRAYADDSALINSRLLGGKGHAHTDKINEQISYLKDAINKAPALTKEHHVYSGLGEGGPDEHEKTVNKIFKTKSFMSTSISPEIAAAHAQYKGGRSRYEWNILHIHLPVGYKGGRYIAKHSSYAGEGEFLIAPDQKFKILGKTTHDIESDDGTTHVWHAVPHDVELKEATYHEPLLFSGLRSYTQDISKRGYGSKLKVHRNEVVVSQNMFQDIIQQHERLNQNNDHHHLIRRYTMTTEARDLNQYEILKHKGKHIHDDNVEEFSSALSDHIKQSPALTEEVHVYAGFKDHPLKTLIAGESILHTPAFTSTSIRPATAESFVKSEFLSPSEYVYRTRRHILHFHLPKGYNRAVYVGTNSEYPHEQEMLLDKGQKWKLTGIQRRNSTSFKKFIDDHGTAKRKDIHHTYIYHLVPHEDEPLKETYSHNPDVIRNFTPEYDGKSVVRKRDYALHLHNLVRAAYDESLQQFRKNNDFSEVNYNKFTPHETRHIENYVSYSTALNNHLLAKHIKGEEVVAAPIENSAAPPLHHYDWGTGDTLETNVKDAVFHISKAISKAQPLAEETHVYSGMSNFNMDKHVGDVIHTPAYTSTSYHPITARNFAGRNNPTGLALKKPGVQRDYHIIHFKLPAGYNRGITPNNPAEQEYILDRDQKWKITGHVVRKSSERITDYNRYGKHRKYTRYHIWSVEPHEEDTSK